jgi:protocatechuate 3,4-dioxygenase alpha subunit
MAPARLTPSQTVGPFFGPALVRGELEQMVEAETRGARITIAGRIFDGDGAAVPDAMVEVWQANAEGRYDHPEDRQEKLLDPHFHGFGRFGTDRDGRFRIVTIKPGAVPGPRMTLQAPHLNLSIFARGLLNRVVTRIYFPGEPLNQTDPALNAVPADRRATLIATRDPAGAGDSYLFDIFLQGDRETVFFDI